jgi:hypothetical protein
VGGFAVPYAIRSRGKRDRQRCREGRRALLFGPIGFALPVAVSVVAWRSLGFDGIWLSSRAAIVGAMTLSIIPIAIRASHMADWYLLLPFVYGLPGPPIWELDGLTAKRRRRSRGRIRLARVTSASRSWR